MLNIIASCLLALTVHVSTPDSIQLMSTEAPKPYHLGAGDRLGQRVFENYKSVVRARQHEREPRLAGNADATNWSIAVRLGDRIVRLDCVDGKRQVVLETAPPQSDARGFKM